MWYIITTCSKLRILQSDTMDEVKIQQLSNEQHDVWEDIYSLTTDHTQQLYELLHHFISDSMEEVEDIFMNIASGMLFSNCTVKEKMLLKRTLTSEEYSTVAKLADASDLKSDT